MPKIIGGSLHEHREQTRQKLFAALSALMAETSLKEQPYRSIPAVIEVERIGLRLASPGPDLGAARIVWESGEREPSFGPALGFQVSQEQWIEAEAEWPDGRRAFGVWERGSR